MTALFSGVGAQAAQRLGLRGSTVHLDSTRFHADGEYAYDAQDGVIEIVPGYSRDHRPELNQAVLNLVVEQRAGLPLLMEPLSGNACDKVSFGELIERHIDQLNTEHGVDYWVADSALYTRENLKTLSAHQGKWISRVPETIALAQEARDGVDAPMQPLAKGYWYRPVEIEYGGVAQRWRVILSGTGDEARRSGDCPAVSAQWREGTQSLREANELDTDRLPDAEVWAQYQAQQQAERGFRFLKDPRFQANTLFLKSPKRVMALLMVMTVCLVVYAALEYRVRTALSEQRRTVADQNPL